MLVFLWTSQFSINYFWQLYIYMHVYKIIHYNHKIVVTILQSPTINMWLQHVHMWITYPVQTKWHWLNWGGSFDVSLCAYFTILSYRKRLLVFSVAICSWQALTTWGWQWPTIFIEKNSAHWNITVAQWYILHTCGMLMLTNNYCRYCTYTHSDNISSGIFSWWKQPLLLYSSSVISLKGDKYDMLSHCCVPLQQTIKQWWEKCWMDFVKADFH